MEFLLLEDRQPVSTLSNSDAELLRSIGLVKEDSVERVYFCGALINNNQSLIFLPRNSSCATKDVKASAPELASMLLLALYKYKSSRSISSGADEADERSNGLDVLSDIVWLLKDYISHGLYSAKIRARTLNAGRTNWNRTIKKETPYAGINGAPVYLTLHSEKTTLDEQSPVSLIHAEVIKELDSLFSWIVTRDASVQISADIGYLPPLYDSLEAKIEILEKAIAVTYSDRETRLLTCLINYLKDNSGGYDGRHLIGVKLFQGAWEEMLRATLPNVRPINHILPKPVLYLRHSDNPAQTRGMLTDIAAFVDSRVSIIDAKYYRAEGVNDAPGWADIVKQLYYGKAFKAVKPELEVTNWFIFPGMQKDLTEGPIRAICIIDPSLGVALDEEFPPIGCAYLCPLEVLKKYVSGSKFSDFEAAALYSRPDLSGAGV